MCEFCKSGKRDIILNDDGNIICLTADAVIAIDKNTGKKHKNQIAINYCPICGRKLEPSDDDVSTENKEKFVQIMRQLTAKRKE